MGIADAIEEFAAWCEGTSPLYERLARGIADDPDLLDLAAAVPDDRSPPHLLLAAVHYLLLDGRAHPLAEYYPTCVDDPADGDPVPAFREFCREHADEIRAFVRTHRTQTNAVRRCAALYPAVAHVARLTGDRPLALVEVGASAGLNLLLDRYGYDYDGERVGRRDSPVLIESGVRGDRSPPLPAEPPAIASRTGIDLHPLDVADPDDVRALRAFVWPEHAARHDLLRRAVGIAREDPPDLVAGDAVEVLPDVLDAVPREIPICGFDTHVRYQMDDDRAERLDAAIADAPRGDLHWLSSAGAAPDREHGIRLRHATAAPDGTLRTREIAVYEQHGRWIEWLDGG